MVFRSEEEDDMGYGLLGSFTFSFYFIDQANKDLGVGTGLYCTPKYVLILLFYTVHTS